MVPVEAFARFSLDLNCARMPTLTKGAGLSKTIKELRRGSAGRGPFSCLHDLLSDHGRSAPDRSAILAPGRRPMTYGALWMQANDVVRGLRSLGVGRTDRVAVVLPDGPEAAVAMIAVAAGAVCVPLNPGFTDDEYQRYFGELHLAALLTRADLNSASRARRPRLGHTRHRCLAAAQTKGPARSGLSVRAPQRVVDDEFASSADDAFILLDLGQYVAAKNRPSDPCERLSVSPQRLRRHGTWVSGPIAERAASFPWAWLDLRASGRAGGRLQCGLYAGFDATAFFGWLTEFRPTWYTAVPAIHRAILSAADPHRRAAKRSSLAARSFGFHVPGARSARAGWKPCLVSPLSTPTA